MATKAISEKTKTGIKTASRRPMPREDFAPRGFGPAARELDGPLLLATCHPSLAGLRIGGLPRLPTVAAALHLFQTLALGAWKNL
jgi:hypothetical protein